MLIWGVHSLGFLMEMWGESPRRLSEGSDVKMNCNKRERRKRKLVLLLCQVAQRQKKKIYVPMQEMQIPSLGQEGLLEKEMATHSSILAWEILWIEEPGRLQSIGSQKSQT